MVGLGMAGQGLKRECANELLITVRSGGVGQGGVRFGWVG